MKLGKHFVLIYSPSVIKLGVVQLFVFVSLCKFFHMKTKSSVCNSNTHADFRGEISIKKVHAISIWQVNRFICYISHMIIIV